MRETPHDAAVWAGTLGALLALSVTLVHLPASIYGGNAAEFTFGFVVHLVPAAAFVGLLTWAVARLLARLPVVARAWIGGALAGVGVLAWIYGNFLLGSKIALDGRGQGIDFGTPLGSWELALVALAMTMLAAVAVRYTRTAVLYLAVLNVGLAAGTLWELARDPRLAENPFRRLDVAPLYEFGPSGNVVVVLMDSLQADVFTRVIDADPEIASALEGFTLYRDTLGVAPTTVFSLPAIHAGTLYTPGESLDAYYDRTIVRGSFLARMARAGYATTLVNPLRSACPERTLCVESPNIVGSRAEEMAKFVFRLVDLALLRVAPFAWKDDVYDGRRWLVSGTWEHGIFVDNVLQGNAVLRSLAGSATAAGGRPTAKLIHLMSTHAPFILQADCQTTIEDRTYPTPDTQVRCALRSFVAVLDRLKELRIYDDATIALVADHGYGMPNRFQRIGDDWGPWGELMGVANPVFLIKRPGSTGFMTVSDDPISVADLAGHVCAPCNEPERGDAPPDRAVPPRREFLWYRWHEIGWQRAVVAPAELGRYAVVGPLWDRTSWSLVTPLAQRYRLGASIGFTPDDPRPELSPFEWSIAQEAGTWTEGTKATIALDLRNVPAGDLELVADLYAFLPPQQQYQRVTVTANGIPIDEWSFDAQRQGGVRTARIPRGVFREGELRLGFLLPDAVSPASLGLSDDPRRLSVGFRRLQVVPLRTIAANAAFPSPVAGGRRAASEGPAPAP